MGKDNWHLLCELSEEEQTDAVIDDEIGKDILAFRFIKDESKKTYERCLRAVRGDFELFRHVPVEMQTDEIIDIAMDEDSWAFGWIKDEKMKTYERCLRCVRDYGFMLQFVPDELKERVKKELGV